MFSLNWLNPAVNTLMQFFYFHTKVHTHNIMIINRHMPLFTVSDENLNHIFRIHLPCFWKLLPPQQETLFFKEAKIKSLMDMLFILNTDEWKKKKNWTEIWKLRKNCLTNIFTFKSQNCVLCLCLIKILAFFSLDPTSNILVCLLLLPKNILLASFLPRISILQW